MTPWKLLSMLLDYPEDELVNAGRIAEIERFLAWQRATPLEDRRQVYVQTFDFDRRATLYLTYHTQGDRRQRGMELVRIKRRYAEAGLPFTAGELPDYLPALLEFAALSPITGRALLGEFRVPLELVRTRLHELSSPYADLLDIVVAALPRPTKAQVAAARRLAAEGPPTELVGLEPFAVGATS
jgi:nitrate reductase molybdenum cofactor assembly chaperone NarJ/NarW